MHAMQDRRVFVANPHGFCAGVWRAIECVEAALATYGPPVYGLHEIVHNRQVVERLAVEGAVFIDSLDEVPEGRWVVFSVHGVAPAGREQAQQRHRRILEATCPFVSKLHGEVREFAAVHRQEAVKLLTRHAGSTKGNRPTVGRLSE
jgi:4-hydroxy-3-methylbut-2-enyl diphosphate reductase